MGTRFAVWGRGRSSSEIVRGGEYSDRAATLAGERGFGGPGEREDTWYVEVECDEADLDAQTRCDSATVGYCTIKDAQGAEGLVALESAPDEEEMTTMGYTTIEDAAADFAARLGLTSEETRSALGVLRQEFGRWEDLRGAERDRVMRLAWNRVTDGAAWPW